VVELFTAENAAALLTLIALEVVLGVDNIIVLAIVTGKLPPEKQRLARNTGLALAGLMRIGLLFSLSWLMGLTEPLVRIAFFNIDQPISGRDLILILGGFFLIAKAVYEIHDKLEGAGHLGVEGKRAASFSLALLQIIAMDMIFSLDSVITAIGMVDEIPIMIVAVVVSVGVMFIFAGPITRFVEAHPTIKVLALSFLILIGVVLVADGFGQHVNKGYIYTAMAFSLVVELLNVRMLSKKKKGETGHA